MAEADLVVHVIDSASPERDRHITAVHRVLTEVGAEHVPRLEVYNKGDLVGPEERRRLQAAYPLSVIMSARTGQGRDDLLEVIAARLALDVQRVTLTFDATSDHDRQLVMAGCIATPACCSTSRPGNTSRSKPTCLGVCSSG